MGEKFLLHEYEELINIHIMDSPKKFISQTTEDLIAEMEIYTEDEMISLANGTLTPSSKILLDFIEKTRKASYIYDVPSFNTCDSFSISKRNIKKKDYEVKCFLELISQLTDQNATFIDFGAGKGYLAKKLSEMNCSVHAIESDIEKCKHLCEYNLIVHNLKITRFSTLEQIIPRSVLLNTKDLDCKEKYCFYSLHACGNLSREMIRLFLECPRANTLINIGCCYNLIIDPTIEEKISMISEKYQKIEFSRNALMLACQTPRRWNESIINTFKNNHSKYVERTNGEKFQISRKRLSIIWTLKSFLAPVIESIILLDRFEILRDNGILNVKLFQLFNYKQSPRNIAIVASKNEEKKILFD